MIRTDITKYMIHSVRELKKTDLPKSEHEFNENDYYPLAYDRKLESEFDVLVNIIREGGLRANLSFRKGKSTIYGNDPVICFTEMPLLNFLQYVQLRRDRSRFTEYGIAVLKKEVYNNGGRPVISGLSLENKFEYIDVEKRILKPEILPLTEQYRYVHLDLGKNTDWTHEREWRIACKRGNKDLTIRDDYRADYFLTYGLNVFSDMLFSEVIIILNTEEEAKNMHEIVQDQLDCGYAKGGEEFCVKIKYLIVEKAVAYIADNHISRIEELPENIFYQHKYGSLSDIQKEKVHFALKKCRDLANQFADDFFKINNLDTEEKRLNYDISGFAVVCAYDSNNPYYRYLLNESLANAVSGTIWINDLSKEIPFLQSITYREYIAKRQCEILNSEIDNIFSVYSAWD